MARTARAVTALAAILARRIAAMGPMTLADYMAECLLNPDHGYYATRDPFGAAGDFTTAPEISQMFGELVGLWLAQCWLDQGAPQQFVLAEIGPGRGTLMADILRATVRVPGFADAARPHLVEASAHLRAVQRQTLGDRPVVWHDRMEALPQAPLFLVANEFFDALPIRQFQRAQRGWRERVVALDGNGALTLALAPATGFAALDHRLADTVPGDIVETCAAALPIVAEIGTRLARHGGAALIVDYGGWRSRGDTFQALAAHRPVDPLAAPGQADLTAHVDFEALARAADPARVSPLVTQGALLERLGIGTRAEALAQNLTGEALASHRAAYRRLTHPQEMGNLFKALALTQATAPLPPGFAP